MKMDKECKANEANKQGKMKRAAHSPNQIFLEVRVLVENVNVR